MTKRIVIRVNSLARSLFSVNKRRTRRKLSFDDKVDALKAKFAAEDAKDETLMNLIKKQLREHIVQNDAQLFSGVLSSFTTAFAIVGRRTVHTRLKVLNQEQAVEAARAAGIIRKVCVLVVDPKKLEEVLAEHPELTPKFGTSIEPASTYKSLNVKPTGPFFKQFDPHRLTDKAITL